MAFRLSDLFLDCLWRDRCDRADTSWHTDLWKASQSISKEPTTMITGNHVPGAENEKAGSLRKKLLKRKKRQHLKRVRKQRMKPKRKKKAKSDSETSSETREDDGKRWRCPDREHRTDQCRDKWYRGR